MTPPVPARICADARDPDQDTTSQRNSDNASLVRHWMAAWLRRQAERLGTDGALVGCCPP